MTSIGYPVSKSVFVNIIIVNYNSWKDTIECVSSLLFSTYKNYRIFIVDNASSSNDIDELSDVLEKKNITTLCVNEEELKSNKTYKISHAKIVLVKSTKNLGYAVANNIVLKHLLSNNSEDGVWLLNPDMIVGPKVLEDLISIWKDNYHAIIGNTTYCYYQKDKLIHLGGFRIKKYSHGINYTKKIKGLKNMDAISGGSLFSSLTIFEKVGLLPEHYFLYWEETDFCTKASKMGYDFKVNLKSKIYDKGGTEANSSFLKEYLYLYNGLMYYKKNKFHLIPIVLLSTFAKQIKALLFESSTKYRAISRANLDFIKSLMGKTINVKERAGLN